MKLVISALAATLLAAPLAAQTAKAPMPAPSPAPSTGTKYSLDTPIETIAADPAGKAVLDADFPGMTIHPMYDQFKAMSLAQLQPMSQGQITDAQVAKAKADLAAVK